MLITEVRLAHIRSHVLFSTEISPHTTIIIGKNGSGKTSLIEAIYVLYRGTSFRGSDKEIIQHGDTRAEAKIIAHDQQRSIALSTQHDKKVKKEFTINEKKAGRLSIEQRLPVVLFEPDELRLLTSSPQKRREFLDGIIARLSPTYSTVLNRFTRTLAQRNELLKNSDSIDSDLWHSHLFAWDVKLAELSATIIKTRTNFVLHCNDHLSRLYSDIAGTPHKIEARYESDFTHGETLQQQILHRLESTREADAARGFTSVGPHRDDIAITLDNHPASETASRGELRSIMLAFKLLEVELQLHHSGKKPLILLDDVLSELDASREAHLMEALADYQTIITATDVRSSIVAQKIIHLGG